MMNNNEVYAYVFVPKMRIIEMENPRAESCHIHLLFCEFYFFIYMSSQEPVFEYLPRAKHYARRCEQVRRALPSQSSH